MSVTPLLPISGVPNELIEALNIRFRELSGGSSLASSAGKPGIFFTTKARPDANGTTVGTFGTDTETGIVYQVQTVGSQQTWVTVAPGIDAQFASATADLTLSGSYADIVGATITLKRAGRYLLTACFDLIGAGASHAGLAGLGIILADGSQVGNAAVLVPLVIKFTPSGAVTLTPATQGVRATVYQQAMYTAPTAGKVVKLQAEVLSGSSGSSVASHPGTCLTAVWIGP